MGRKGNHPLVLTFFHSLSPCFLSPSCLNLCEEPWTQFTGVYPIWIPTVQGGVPQKQSHRPATSPKKFLLASSNQLYVTGKKCQFHMYEISFLEYIISPKLVTMNQSKVSTVTNWLVHSILKEQQRFLSFVNIYRRFSRGFISIAAPTSYLNWRRDLNIWAGTRLLKRLLSS